MSAVQVMNTNPTRLSLDQTFAEAVSLMREHSEFCLPVVDHRGEYRGMFSLDDIWTLLLPKAALLAGDSLRDLAFVADGADEMRHKMADAAARPVRDFLGNEHVPPVHPDTPLKEVVLLLYHHGEYLPVVERGTNQLVGMISPGDVLRMLAA